MDRLYSFLFKSRNDFVSFYHSNDICMAFGHVCHGLKKAFRYPGGSQVQSHLQDRPFKKRRNSSESVIFWDGNIDVISSAARLHIVVRRELARFVALRVGRPVAMCFAARAVSFRFPLLFPFQITEKLAEAGFGKKVLIFASTSSFATRFELTANPTIASHLQNQSALVMHSFRSLKIDGRRNRLRLPQLPS